LAGRSSVETWCTEVYGGDDAGQVQARNGSNGQHESDRYAKGEFFVAPKAALFNPAIGDLAFRVLCYALAKGRDWVAVWKLKEEFGVGPRAMNTAMKQLEAVGHARLEYQRGHRGTIVGSRYRIFRRPLTETAVKRVSADRSVKEGTQSSARIPVQSLKRDAVSTTPARSLRKQAVSLEELGYSEEEREVIEAYHEIVCDNDRSWRRVNKYTERVCDVIETFFTSDAYDAEIVFRKVLAASRCGCGDEYCEHCGEVHIPRRGQSRTLVNMSWKNY
jgi:hypothetical protein